MYETPTYANDCCVVMAGYYSNKQRARCGWRERWDPLSGRHGEGGHGWRWEAGACCLFLFSFSFSSVLTLCRCVWTGIKESVCWTPPPEVNPNKTCEYQALCSRFKDLLTLPGEFHSSLPATSAVSDLKSCNNLDLRLLCHRPSDGYFNEDAKYNLCYCESCHKLRGDEAYYKRGEPPRDYALPFGWCRFALRWEDDLWVLRRCYIFNNSSFTQYQGESLEKGL